MNRTAKLCHTIDQATLDLPPAGDDVQHWRTALSNGEDPLDPPPTGDDLQNWRTALSHGEGLLDLPTTGDERKLRPSIPIWDAAEPSDAAGPPTDDQPRDGAHTEPRELGGRPGPDPTRYGDWESKGRCIDF